MENTEMTIYQICNTCIMDTSDPGISFDERGGAIIVGILSRIFFRTGGRGVLCPLEKESFEFGELALVSSQMSPLMSIRSSPGRLHLRRLRLSISIARIWITGSKNRISTRQQKLLRHIQLRLSQCLRASSGGCRDGCG